MAVIVMLFFESRQKLVKSAGLLYKFYLHHLVSRKNYKADKAAHPEQADWAECTIQARNMNPSLLLSQYFSKYLSCQQNFIYGGQNANNFATFYRANNRV